MTAFGSNEFPSVLPWTNPDGTLTLEARQWIDSRGWKAVETRVVEAAVPYIDFTALGDYDELIVRVRGLAIDTVGTRNVRLSTDNGASWLDQSGDYANIVSAGTEAAAMSMPVQSEATIEPRSGAMMIFGLRSGAPMAYVPNRPATVFIETEQPINGVRVYPGSGGNITAGTVSIYGT